MSVPTYEEMEAKRQEMITSFRDIAAAMTRCVKVIEDYTSLSPVNLNKASAPSAAQQGQQYPGSIPGNLASLLPANLAAAVAGTLPRHTSTAFAQPTAGNGNGTATVPEKKERKKKEKKPRDPNAPKRPPSAYILFQNSVRDDIRNSNPSMAYREILAVIAQKWKELPDASKKVYEAAYSDAQEQFRIEETAYAKKLGMPTAPTPAARAVVDSSDSSDDSDDSSDDDSTPAAPVIPAAKTPKPPTTTTPLQVHPLSTPVPAQTLQAASAVPTPAAASSTKKEKKRRNKEDESAVAATLDPGLDKKKKRKNKE